MLAYLAQGKNLRAEISLLFLARTHAEMLGGVYYYFDRAKSYLGEKRTPFVQEHGLMAERRERLPRAPLDQIQINSSASAFLQI